MAAISRYLIKAIERMVNTAFRRSARTMSKISSPRKSEATLRRWALALERLPEIRELAECTDLTSVRVKAVADQLAIDRATVYRLLRKYRAVNTVEGLVGRTAGWRVDRPRMSEAVLQVMKGAVDSYFLTSQAPSLSALHRQITRECKAISLAAPARSTIGRYVSKIGRRRLAGSRGGRSRAEAETMRPGALILDTPNAEWQIDHSPADVIVVDVATRQPIGRPWLTFIIDVASRVVVGLHISLEAPNVVSVGMALRHAILDKAEAMRARGVEGEWPGFGLPETIHTDNGADFKSQAFAHACANQGIELRFRPIGAARYGGHIERLIGTAQREMHLLPGTTFSNIAERGTYDSEAKAVMTLDELEVWLWRFVACDYNRRLHSALGRAPLDVWTAWRDGSGFRPRQASNTDQLAFDFLPCIGRSISRQGIVLNKIHYFEPFLEALFDAGDRRLIIHYDPRDLSRIYFKSANGIQTLRYRNLAHAPMSLWELKAAQRRLVAEGRGRVSEDEIFEARQRNMALVSGAKSKTRKQRQQAERSKRSYAQALEVSPVSSAPRLERPVETGAPEIATNSPSRVGEIETW